MFYFYFYECLENHLISKADRDVGFWKGIWIILFRDHGELTYIICKCIVNNLNEVAIRLNSTGKMKSVHNRVGTYIFTTSNFERLLIMVTGNRVRLWTDLA